MLNAIDRSIITSIARTLFVTAWIEYKEQMGDSRIVGDFSAEAPPTPPEVLEVGFYVGGLIANLNENSLHMLLREAAVANKMDADAFSDSKELQDEFGHSLAMMATGSGVSWFDSHADFPLKTPHVEFTWLDLDPDQFPGKDDTVSTAVEIKNAKEKLQKAVDAEVMALVTGGDASEASAAILRARFELLVVAKKASRVTVDSALNMAKESLDAAIHDERQRIDNDDHPDSYQLDKHLAARKALDALSD